MKTLTAIYQGMTERERRLALGALLLFLGLVLLIAKIFAGGFPNGQSVAGFVAGMSGLHLLWKETR